MARPISAPRRPRACPVFRADPIRQGRRPRRSDAADLVRLGDRPRHQGRELDADRRLAGAVRPRAAVRSDQRGERCLQSAARGPPRRVGGPRRPEHRRRPGRPRGRVGAPEPLGEDQPFAAGRRDPARALRRAGQDARRRRQLPLRSAPPDRDDAASDDDDAAPRRTRRASGHRQLGPRALEQERQRALGRPVDRDVVPRSLPRSGRRDGDAPMRLAHPRPGGGRGAGHALSGRAAVGHQPHQAARALDPQPDRPASDRGARSRSGDGIACC